MTHALITPPGVAVEDGYLRVPLSRGHGDFHFRWLRHNNEDDRHPLTGERIACSSDLPDELRPARAEIDGDSLVVTWAHDGRTTRHALGWLEEHAYSRDRAAAPRPPSDPAWYEIQGGDRPLSALAEEAVRRVAERGAAIVRRRSGARPEDETEPLIDAFAAAGLRVIGTHFGRIEDLRTDNTTNANTDQLGYTQAAIDPHTDQPFIQKPPRYQVLQSIRAADTGGESYVVDALLAARYLEALDADAFQQLTTIPVRFHRKQKAFESIVDAPILRFGATEADAMGGAPSAFQIRYSYFTLAPFARPFAEMEAWYRAYDRFARIVRDPRNQARFTLAPGDFLLYDNHRMLHARTGFRGARWVRGVYFDP